MPSRFRISSLWWSLLAYRPALIEKCFGPLVTNWYLKTTFCRLWSKPQLVYSICPHSSWMKSLMTYLFLILSQKDPLPRPSSSLGSLTGLSLDLVLIFRGLVLALIAQLNLDECPLNIIWTWFPNLKGQFRPHWSIVTNLKWKVKASRTCGF